VTDDLVLTDDDAVQRYEELYGRISEASMSMHESLELLVDTAKNSNRRS
jgi:hypothetical protein